MRSLLPPRELLPMVGPLALVLVHPEEPAWPLALLGALLLAPALPRPPAGSRRGGVLALAVLLLTVLLSAAAPEPLLPASRRFVALIGIALALSPPEAGRGFKLHVISFLLLLTAAAQTEEVVFALPFLAFVGLLPAALADLERAERGLPGRTGRREGATAVGLAVLVVAVFPVLPRSGRSVLPRGAFLPESLAAMGEEITLQSITELKTSSRVALRVRADRAVPERAKWRGIAYDTFDGTTWSSRAPLDGTISFGTALERQVRPVPRGARVLRQEIRMEPGISKCLYGARDVVRVGSRALFHPRLNRRGSDLLLLWVPRAAIHYVVESAPCPPEDEGEEGLRRCLQLPALDGRYVDLAERVTRGRSGTRERLEALEGFFLTEFAYTRSIARPEGIPPLQDFLFTSRRGHCELFATGLAVLARTLRIPARVVDGFARGEYSNLTGSYVVRRSDAHAWVEAFVPGKGWVDLDPTPAEPIAATLVERLAGMRSAVSDLWNRYVADFGAMEQRALWERIVAAAPALLPVAAAAAAVLLGRRWRRLWPGTPARRAARGSSALGPLLRRALLSLRPLGVRAAPEDTAREVLARARERAVLPSLEALVGLHESVAYGGSPLPEWRARREARSLLRSLRREVRSRQG